MGANGTADPPLRYPITGIAGCCARTAIGHAAAPLTNVMNSRRFIRQLLTPTTEGIAHLDVAEEIAVLRDIARPYGSNGSSALAVLRLMINSNLPEIEREIRSVSLP
jgi:hypothetical protein